MRNLLAVSVVLATMTFLGGALQVADAEPFTEVVCTNSACSQNCVGTMLDTGICYGTSVVDTSIKVFCKDGGSVVEQVIYQDSANCDSFSHTSTILAGQCGEVIGSNGAQYIMFECGGDTQRWAHNISKTNKTLVKPVASSRVNVTVDLMLSLPKDPVKRAALKNVPGMRRDSGKQTVFLPAQLLTVLSGGRPHQTRGPVRLVTVSQLGGHTTASSSSSDLLRAEDYELTSKGLLVKEAALRSTSNRSSRSAKKKTPNTTASTMMDEVTIFVAGYPIATFKVAVPRS